MPIAGWSRYECVITACACKWGCYPNQKPGAKEGTLTAAHPIVSHFLRLQCTLDGVEFMPGWIRREMQYLILVSNAWLIFSSSSTVPTNINSLALCSTSCLLFTQWRITIIIQLEQQHWNHSLGGRGWSSRLLSLPSMSCLFHVWDKKKDATLVPHHP